MITGTDPKGKNISKGSEWLPTLIFENSILYKKMCITYFLNHYIILYPDSESTIYLKYDVPWVYLYALFIEG